MANNIKCSNKLLERKKNYDIQKRSGWYVNILFSRKVHSVTVHNKNIKIYVISSLHINRYRMYAINKTSNQQPSNPTPGCATGCKSILLGRGEQGNYWRSEWRVSESLANSYIIIYCIDYYTGWTKPAPLTQSTLHRVIWYFMYNGVRRHRVLQKICKIKKTYKRFLWANKAYPLSSRSQVRFLLILFRRGKLTGVNDPSSFSFSQTTTAAHPRETTAAAATRHIDRRVNGRAREIVAAERDGGRWRRGLSSSPPRTREQKMRGRQSGVWPGGPRLPAGFRMTPSLATANDDNAAAAAKALCTTPHRRHHRPRHRPARFRSERDL